MPHIFVCDNYEHCFKKKIFLDEHDNDEGCQHNVKVQKVSNNSFKKSDESDDEIMVNMFLFF